MGGYFGTDEVHLGTVKEADIKPLDKFAVERCMVALSQPEIVSSWEDGRNLLDNTVLSLGIFARISF